MTNSLKTYIKAKDDTNMLDGIIQDLENLSQEELDSLKMSKDHSPKDGINALSNFLKIINSQMRGSDV